MNHLTYPMAIARQEELMRRAAQYRLVSRTTMATDRKCGEVAERPRRRFSWISAAAAWRHTRSNVYTQAGR